MEYFKTLNTFALHFIPLLPEPGAKYAYQMFQNVCKCCDLCVNYLRYIWDVYLGESRNVSNCWIRLDTNITPKVYTNLLYTFSYLNLVSKMISVEKVKTIFPVIIDWAQVDKQRLGVGCLHSHLVFAQSAG